MTHSDPEVIVMSVIQYTHTALSNCSLLLESKQYCDRGLNQGKQRQQSDGLKGQK